MNIQTSNTFAARPQVKTVTPSATAPAETSAPQQEPATAADSFQSSGGTLSGPIGRAIYGAALYGLPAIAGATMGINGVLPGALVGAGLGAATHLDNSKQAAIFAATGAIVGAGAGYIGFLGAGAAFKLPAVLIAAAVGAGTQALFSISNEG